MHGLQLSVVGLVSRSSPFAYTRGFEADGLMRYICDTRLYEDWLAIEDWCNA